MTVTSIALVAFLSIGLALPTFAITPNHRVDGKITMSVNFKKSEIQYAKDWLSNSKAIGEKYINNQIANTSDPDRLSLLKKALTESRSINVDSLFKTEKDGSADIAVPLSYAQVSIDGSTINTDIDGNYSVNTNSSGSKTITVSVNGEPVVQKSISIQNGIANTTSNINAEITSSDIVSAANNMSENMASAQSIRYYDIYPVGTVLASGNEQMKVVASNDIVSCNEISSNSSSSSDIRSHLSSTDFSSFPFNNSDCANSIGLGLLAESNPIELLFYSNSVNCAIEAAQAAGRRMHLSTQNVYCNGKNKSGHYNCSWFNGIGNPERLHTN